MPKKPIGNKIYKIKGKNYKLIKNGGDCTKCHAVNCCDKRISLFGKGCGKFAINKGLDPTT